MEPGTRVSCRSVQLVQLERLAWLLMSAALLPAAFAVLVFLSTPRERIGAVVLSAAFAAGLFALGNRLRKRNLPVGGGAIVARPEGLEVHLGDQRTLLVAPVDVERGYVPPHHDVAVFELRGGPKLTVQLAAGTSVKYNDLLSHVRATVHEQPFVVELRGYLPLFLLAALGLFLTSPMFLALGATLGVVVVAACAITLAVLYEALGKPKAFVGRDGIRLDGRRTFLPYRDLVAVEPISRGIRLRLRRRTIALETRKGTATENELLRAQVVKALGEYREQAHEAAAPLASLARRGRPIEEWRQDVERLTTVAPGFRDQPWSRDALERVLDDASSPPEERLGAALALRAEPSARPRIRLAASSSADEGLRAALAACGDDEDVIDELPLERATLSRRSE